MATAALVYLGCRDKIQDWMPLTTETYFLLIQSLEGQINMPARLVSGENLLFGLQMATILLCPYTAFLCAHVEGERVLGSLPLSF